MANSNRVRPPRANEAYERSSADVMNFVAALTHPRKEELLAVRDLILSASPEIREGIKWNAPSFWRGAWFATFHLRAKPGLMLVLHQGVKMKSVPRERFVADPDGLLTWITNDRCTVAIEDVAHLRKNAAALTAIIREWSQKVTLRSRSQ